MNLKIENIKKYLGDIDYYLEQRNVENLREVEKRTVVKATLKKQLNNLTKIRKS